MFLSLEVILGSLSIDTFCPWHPFPTFTCFSSTLWCLVLITLITALSQSIQAYGLSSKFSLQQNHLHFSLGESLIFKIFKKEPHLIYLPLMTTQIINSQSLNFFRYNCYFLRRIPIYT